MIFSPEVRKCRFIKPKKTADPERGDAFKKLNARIHTDGELYLREQFKEKDI